jgi:NADH dehydrogenase
MNRPNIVVFGGTGFLGKRVVRNLLMHGFAVGIATRHPARSKAQFRPDPYLLAVEADVHDEQQVAAALKDTQGAVNAVSLYLEHGPATFQSVHVEAARRVAAQAHRLGVLRLVHLSGIGSDPASPSLYIRKRGQGELAVRAVFADACLIRPAVMFAPDDAFLTVLLGLVRRVPVQPLFGSGHTRLQPVFVEDVAEAIVRTFQRSGPPPTVVECAGPRVYTYRELLEAVAAQAHLRVRPVPLPFAVWHALAAVAQLLPNPPLTHSQVELLEIDTVASPSQLGLAELDIQPRPLEGVLGEMLGAA